MSHSACTPPVTSPDSLSLCHTHSHSLAPAWPTISPGYSDLPWYKTLSCQSNPPSLSLYASVSPASALFVAVCSQLRGSLCAGLGGPVWTVVRRGGGRPAEKGVLNCSHTQHPPPTDLSLTWPFGEGGGGQSKGCREREMELRTLRRHTRAHTHCH